MLSDDPFYPKKKIEIQELEEKMSSLNLQNREVGFTYDERMLLHKHYLDTHHERPERAQIIFCNLIAKGLKEKLVRIPSMEIDHSCLLDVHSFEYLQNVENLKHPEDNSNKNKLKNQKYSNESNTKNDILSVKKKIETNFGENTFRLCYDTYDNYYTPLSSSFSAGSLLSCAIALVNNTVSSAFAIIRPPGHHANKEQCRGFCFYNNVAVTAKYLIKHYSLKIAIVDWDVHHGDGTQEIFYEENNPLFISLHRHDKGKFYPHVSGNINEQGSNKGLGFTINVPWNTKNIYTSTSGIGDDEYIFAFENLILPVLEEYKPDIIIVSSGFDACENDPLGEMSLTPLGYSYMTSRLKKTCNKLLIALEGGYNLNSLSRASEAIIRTLLEEKTPFKNLMIDKFQHDAFVENKTIDFYSKIDDFQNDYFPFKNVFSPSDYVKNEIKKIILMNAPFWKSLQEKLKLLDEESNENDFKIKTSLLRKNNIETVSSLINIIQKLITDDKQKIDKEYWMNIFEIVEYDFYSPKIRKTKNKASIEDKKHDSENTNIVYSDFTEQKSFPCEKKINSFLRINIGKEPINECFKEKLKQKYFKNMHKSLRTISRLKNFRLEGISSNKDLKEEKLNWNFTNGIFDVNEKNIETVFQKFINLNRIDKHGVIVELERLITKAKWLYDNNIDIYNIDLIIIFKKIINKEKDIIKYNNLKLKKFKIIKDQSKKFEILLKLNGLKSYGLLNQQTSTQKFEENNNFINGINSFIRFLQELL